MELRNRAQGRWHGILTQLGIDPAYLRNRHGPCPGCGGNDRFRFDDKDGRGTFYCGGGGDPDAGDGFGLIKHIHHCDFPTAARMVEEALGGKELPPIQVKTGTTYPPGNSKTTNTARRLWMKAQKDDALVADHPYCKLKGIEWAHGAGRTVASGRVVGCNADCIVVPMKTLEGKFVGVECINPEGKKQTFGSKGILLLGNTLDKSLPVYVVEGWADGVAAWRYYGNVVVVVAFGKGKQESIARQIYERRPDREVVIVWDRDAA